MSLVQIDVRWVTKQGTTADVSQTNTMNSGIQNLIISLGAMQVARKIPFDDPQVLNYVRVGYVVSQLIILTVYYYVSTTVRPALSNFYLT